MTPNFNLLFSGLALISGLSVSAQCSFTGLDPIYCSTDAPATLIPSGASGYFSGPGVTNNQFSPVSAGPGKFICYAGKYFR